MSSNGKFTAVKSLAGECAIDPCIEPGEKYTTNLVLTNLTSEPKEVTVSDPVAPLVALSEFTASETGSVTGATGFTAAGSGDILDVVTLPPQTEVTYVIVATTEDDACGTSTNCATITMEVEGAKPMSVDAVADTVKIGDPDLIWCLEDRNQFQLQQMLHALFGVDSKCDTQFIMDCVQNGFTFAKLFRIAKPAVDALQRQAPEEPEEEVV